jgi:phage terminase large subunit-like protein
LYQGFNVALMAHKRDGCSAVESVLARTLGPYLAPHPKRDGYIYTPTGAELHIWTLGNKATAMRAARGEAYGTIVIDEAAQCANLYDSFLTAIQPSLADHRGYVIFASTPHGQKNDFFRIYRGLADVRFGGSTGDLNPLPNIQLDYKEKKALAAKGRLNPKYFQQEYDAQFVDLGNVLVSYDMIQYHPVDPDIRNDMWEVHIGMDLAVSEKEEADFSAMVAVARHRSTKDFFVAGAKRFKESQPKRMLEELHVFNDRFHASKIVIESNQFQSALINMWIDDTNLPIIKVRADKDKRTRFAPTAQFYMDGRVWHASQPVEELDPETGRPLIDSETLMPVKKSALPVYFEDELTLFPIAEHDDMVDALAYAVMSFGTYWDDDVSSGQQWGGRGEDESGDDGMEAA